MSQEIGTSHIWIPIDSSDIERGVMPTNDSERAINLHDEFPLRATAKVLQDVWDNRIEGVTETRQGLEIGYTIFNRGAEGGKLFHYLGFGVTARGTGGALEEVGLASELDDYEIVAVEELKNVPRDVKVAGLRKNIKPYADANMWQMQDMKRKYGIIPTAIGGRSKGGRVSTILASHPDMPQLEHVVTADMPGTHQYRTNLTLAVNVLGRENLAKYKGPTLVGIDQKEEDMIKQVKVPEVDTIGPKDLAQQIWMMRGLGALGLVDEFDEAMSFQETAAFTNYHATGNLGMPLETNNQMMKTMMDNYGSRAKAYIAYTRHFSEGHALRFGRQLAHAFRG